MADKPDYSKRIGKQLADRREFPSQTISGKPLPPHQPYTTINLGNKCFTVVDTWIDPQERDKLVLELKALVSAPSPVSVEGGKKPKEASE